MTPSPTDQVPLTYAHARVGTKRYGRDDLVERRRSVRMVFQSPSSAELEPLVRTFERIQGRVAMPNVVGYLIRLHRIHGPDAEPLLRALYAERGTTENLLLAVELYPPKWLTSEDVALNEDHPEREPPDWCTDSEGRPELSNVSHTESPEPNGPATPSGGGPAGWSCYLSPAHIRGFRPDGTSFCATCHP